MDDAQLAQASESIHEPDWTHAPPAVQPVDPAEVPELGTFFFTKRVTAARIGAVVVAGVIAMLGGLAQAIADEWDEPITRDPTTVEQRLIPIAASASP